MLESEFQRSRGEECAMLRAKVILPIVRHGGRYGILFSVWYADGRQRSVLSEVWQGGGPVRQPGHSSTRYASTRQLRRGFRFASH